MTPSPPPAAQSPGRPDLWLPFLVLAAAWIAHARAPLEGGWLPADAAVVRDGPVVARGAAGAAEALTRSAWGGEEGPEGWRPLALASLAVEATLWGPAGGETGPFGFHLTNLFLHGLCALLLLRVGMRLAPRRLTLVGVAALLFAVHPVQAGVVATLLARADLLALLFGLLTVLLWLRATSGHPGAFPLAALAWFFALLSKEAALAVPPVLLALDAGPRGLGLGGALRRHGAGYALLLAPLLLFLLLWPGPGGEEAGHVRLALGLEGLARGLLAVLLPVGLVRGRVECAAADGGIAASGAGAVAGGLLLLALLTAVQSPSARRRGGTLLLGLGLGAAVVLVAALAAPPGAALEARFLYLAAPGLVLVPARLLEAATAGLGASRAGRAAGVATVVAVGAVLAALAWREHGAWRSEETWYGALLDRHPTRVAVLLDRSRHLRRGAEADRNRLQAMPTADPVAERVQEEMRAKAASALKLLNRVEEVAGTRNGDLWFERGAIHELLSQKEAAHRALNQALRLDPWRESPPEEVPAEHRPRLSDLHARLGRVEEMRGRLDWAAAHLARAVALRPDDPDLLRRAAFAVLRDEGRRGRFAECLRYLNRALTLATSTAQKAELQTRIGEIRDTARKAAESLMREGAQAEAEADYRRAAEAYEGAVALRPDDPDLLRRAAFAILRDEGRRGRFTECLRYLYRALNLATSTTEKAELQARIDRVQEMARAAAESLMREGRQAEADTDYRLAAQAYEEVLDAQPGRLEAYLALARLRGIWFGNYTLAYALLDEANGVLDELGAGEDDPDRVAVRRLREHLRVQQREEDEAEGRDGR